MFYDDSEIGEEELRNQLARAAAANGWDEPGMEAYDHYDEELRKRGRVPRADVKLTPDV